MSQTIQDPVFMADGPDYVNEFDQVVQTVQPINATKKQRWIVDYVDIPPIPSNRDDHVDQYDQSLQRVKPPKKRPRRRLQVDSEDEQGFVNAGRICIVNIHACSRPFARAATRSPGIGAIQYAYSCGVTGIEILQKRKRRNKRQEKRRRLLSKHRRDADDSEESSDDSSSTAPEIAEDDFIVEDDDDDAPVVESLPAAFQLKQTSAGLFGQYVHMMAHLYVDTNYLRNLRASREEAHPHLHALNAIEKQLSTYKEAAVQSVAWDKVYLVRIH
jgi:hypothetical protein